MKTSKYIASLMLMGILFIAACGGEEKETAEQVFMKQLAGSWQMTSADFDGKDVSASFPGLLIDIGSSKTIAVQNAVPPMWKANSTFTLEKAGTTFLLKREDGLIVSVDQINETKLVLSFLYDADAMGGRTKGVTGGFTFEFEAK
jgi:hypothetical protein